jgi:hypothetical protein
MSRSQRRKKGEMELYGGLKILARHSSALRPSLKPDNQLHRFLFCQSQVNPATMGLRGNGRFFDEMDMVHVDEKWLWICKDGEKYILVDSEEELPYRHVRHKNYVEKVMFFCAQA